jgi:phosphotriesterase-related protein
MTTVPTATGPIDAADLGFTLMHEHVLVIDWAMRQSVPRWFDRAAAVERAVAEAKRAKERGVRTLVDLTPVTIGRDIETIREVAERAEIQIVVATGFYHIEMPWMRAWHTEQLVEMLLPDLLEGIEGTSARAGIIKCATDMAGVTPGNRKLLQVAARLHRRSGAPISTHTAVQVRAGEAQQDVFADEGVDLARVVIGHSGDSTDLDYLTGLMTRGSLIGMDRFGIELPATTQQRVDTIAALCRRGYAGQMVLSHDAACAMDWFPPGFIAERLPNWNWRYIPDVVIPMLRQAGVSDADLRAMTVENPRTVFERNTGPY